MKLFFSNKLLIAGLCMLLVTAIVLCIYKSKRKIIVIGFGYKDDLIKVSHSGTMIRTVKIDTNNIDSNRVCAFYEPFNYYTFDDNISLTIQIDSAGNQLMDTTLVLDKKIYSRSFLLKSQQKPGLKESFL